MSSCRKCTDVYKIDNFILIFNKIVIHRVWYVHVSRDNILCCLQ